jgi:hypothetical protein
MPTDYHPRSDLRETRLGPARMKRQTNSKIADQVPSFCSFIHLAIKHLRFGTGGSIFSGAQEFLKAVSAGCGESRKLRFCSRILHHVITTVVAAILHFVDVKDF